MKLFNRGERNDNLRSEILSRFISGVMTDDERASLFGLPEGCRMREGAKIICPEKLKCGKHVWIGENAVLDASGGLEIGDHTSIGLSVFIWSHTSWLENVAMKNYSNSPLITRTPTKIGSGCFIAGPSVIYPGVTIGNKVVVAPLTCVTRNVADMCVIAGNPFDIIKRLTQETIDEEIKRVLAEKVLSEKT